MFSGIRDTINWAKSLQFAGWKPTKPTQYTFYFQNNRYDYTQSLTLGFDTNLKNNFKISLGFRF